MIVECKNCCRRYNLDEILLNQSGSKVRCIKCGNIFVAYPPSSCSQKDGTDIKDSDWLDPMADIYALISNDQDYSPSENLKKIAFLNDTEKPEMVLNQDSPKRKHFHRDYTVKAFYRIIVAFVLIGSISFYFFDWFSEVQRNKSSEVVQKTITIIFKKMPNMVDNENVSILFNNGVEYQSAVRSEEKAVIGDTQPAVDPVEMGKEVKDLSSPTKDDKIENGTPNGDFQKNVTSYSETPAVENTDIRNAPEEPDPDSVIDYVLKKRGL
jgi:predicted Zn finger-like uncharacterized protein